MKNLKRFLKGNKNTCFLVKYGIIVEACYVKTLEELKNFINSGKLKATEIIKAVDMYNGIEWAASEVKALFEKIA